MKIALITGVTGQDGLRALEIAMLCLEKGG